MKIKVKDSMKKVTRPEDIYKLLDGYFAGLDKIDQDKEHCFVFHIDSRNHIKIMELVSIGTLDSSLVHPREVYTRAVSERSAKICVAHNHPSGDAEPSHEDIMITQRLVKAGDLLGVKVVDHIIYTKNGYSSMKEKNLM